MIEARGLVRRYGDFTAVDDISFSVASGEILGILGPNGAGKTTTIRMVTGFLPPSAGQVTVNGRDLHADSGKARRDIGYLPENVALYTEMRVDEYLAFRAQLEGMKRGPAREAIDRTVERCLLGDVRGQIIGTLSKGYRQRVGLAAAILHDPQVLVLDEPTVGLDPKQIIAIRELIRELGKDRTLLLSTHILPEVEQLCDRVLIIDRGRIVVDGTPAELRSQAMGQAMLHTLLKDAPEDAAHKLAALEGVEEVHAPGDGRFEIHCAAGADLREAVFRAAVDNGWVLLELVEHKVSLEDVFVRLTRTQEAIDDEVEAATPEGGDPEESAAEGAEPSIDTDEEDER
jgi:ABC-2 type transport system ATP-binding protein